MLNRKEMDRRLEMASNRVLLVMKEQMQREIGALASAEGIEWLGLTTCDQARHKLDGEVSTIVTYETLPDGNWYCLFKEVVERGAQTDVVVVLPAGSDPTGVKSCGANVVEYPLTAAGRRQLVAYMLQRANGAAIG
jgi:hypothetical protein